jgi:hypothetical protein
MLGVAGAVSMQNIVGVQPALCAKDVNFTFSKYLICSARINVLINTCVDDNYII